MKRSGIISPIILVIFLAINPVVIAQIHMKRQLDCVWVMEDERQVFFDRTDRIIRNIASMQNCVWPGSEHVALVKGEVTTLRASLTLS